MSTMSFRLYCESNGWFDRWGRFNADRLEPSLDPQSNNNLLYHAEYIAVLDMYDEIVPNDGKVIEAMFRLHQARPGELKRDPDSGMHQKHDDILGAACMAALVDRQDLAKEILDHLRKHDWQINVLHPETGYLFTLDISRIGGVEQTIEMCAGESLGLWSQLLFGITMVSSAYRSDESGLLMKWLAFRAWKKVSKKKPAPILGAFMSWFERVVARDPLAIGSVFAKYFPKNGKMHPIALYTWGKV